MSRAMVTAATKPPPRWHELVWMANPAMYTVVCWYVLHNADAVRTHLPNFFALTTTKTTRSLVVPRSVPQAFSLGRAVERGDLKEAARLLNVETLARKDLARIADAVLAPRQNTLLGLLSFVNVLGACSLVGAAVSFGPALWILLRPVMLYLAPFGRVVSVLSDPAAFALAAALVAESTRTTRPRTSNAQIAAFGALGVAPAAFAWSLRDNRFPFDWEWDRDGSQIVGWVATWCVSFLTPVAVLSQSRLVGFAAVAALYVALGSVFPPLCFFGLGYAVTGEKFLLRCELASVVLLSAYALLVARSSSILPHHAIAPFRAAVAVFAASTLADARRFLDTSLSVQRRDYDDRNNALLARLRELRADSTTAAAAY